MDASASFDDRFLEGFGPGMAVQTLRRSCDLLPAGGGVYAVLIHEDRCPGFLSKSVGGHFKGKDPSVPVEILKRKWVDGTRVVYVGQGSRLRARIRRLVAFAYGKPVSHWGGRYLWQLADRGKLSIRCLETPGEIPRGIESRMLAGFRSAHGRLPFANLRG